MEYKPIFSYLRYFVRSLILALIIFCMLIAVRSDALAQIGLDDPAWLARAKLFGIEKIIRTSDLIQIWIGSPSSFNATLLFQMAPEFDPQKNNVLEITMRMGPRIHNFRLYWTRIGGNPSSFRQRIYRDGQFHTYMISLGSQPSWGEGISTVALGWNGTHELIEIKKMELRSMDFSDRIRYYWSRFRAPEILSPTTVNFILGPVLLNHPLAFVLGLLYLALLPLLYVILRRGRRKADPSTTDPPHLLRTWFQTASLIFLTLWVAYDVREAYNHIQIMRSEFRYYLDTTLRPRYYLELDDLYDFLSYVEGIVPPSSEVGFYSGRAFFEKARYFLFPRHVLKGSTHPDYIVIFQDPDLSFRDGDLLEGQEIIGQRLKLAGRFSEDAFILEKSSE